MGAKAYEITAFAPPADSLRMLTWMVKPMCNSEPRREILFEGFTDDEILSLPQDQIEALVLRGEPLVFRIGSATVLGEFKLIGDRLIVELAHIESGGEGVLVSLGALARRYAMLHGLRAIEWIVHAVNCAKPNLRLHRVLQRRGFVVNDLPGIGAVYHYVDSVTEQS